PAFEHRPEALNRVRVNGADDVLVVRVADDLMRVFRGEALVANPFVGHEQAHFVGDRLPYEAFEGRGIDRLDDAGDDLAAALDRADDGRLARAEAAAPADMPVLGLAADEGLIDLDRPEQPPLGAVLHRDADAMAHVPGRLVAAGAEHPMDLMRAHALFRVVHQERDLEPLPQRVLGVLEDRSGDDGEPIAVPVAALAQPMEGAGFDLPHFRVAAARAGDAIRP